MRARPPRRWRSSGKLPPRPHDPTAMDQACGEVGEWREFPPGPPEEEADLQRVFPAPWGDVRFPYPPEADRCAARWNPFPHRPPKASSLRAPPAVDCCAAQPAAPPALQEPPRAEGLRPELQKESRQPAHGWPPPNPGCFPRDTTLDRCVRARWAPGG